MERAGTSCSRRGAGPESRHAQKGGVLTPPPFQEEPGPPSFGTLRDKEEGRSLGPIPPQGPELEAETKGQSLGHLFFPEPEDRPRSRGGIGDLPRPEGRSGLLRLNSGAWVRPRFPRI